LQIVIAVECRGRLGNQMFQYAFGLAASHVLGTTLKIDDAELRRLFVLGPPRQVGEQAPGHVVTVSNDAYDVPAEVLEHVTDETTYVGYFQSEEFFRPIADDVRDVFRLRDDHVRAFNSLYAELAEREYVCCHMRRTDYHTFAGGVALPMSYYGSALARLGVSQGTPIVFVGDDLDEARESFRDLPGARFERNDEAIDLQLLRHASDVVVSNSTFAWWGAWLNERPGTRVLAPRHWLGFDFGWEYPPHVIPPGWARVRVKRPWSRRLSPAHVRMTLGRRRRAASRLRRRAAGERAT
jgi:Glycosyl transferase family 11